MHPGPCGGSLHRSPGPTRPKGMGGGYSIRGEEARKLTSKKEDASYTSKGVKKERGKGRVEAPLTAASSPLKKIPG